MNELEELKYALDVTWYKHPEYGDVLSDKSEFYKYALDSLNIKNNELRFISMTDSNGKELRNKIKENSMNPNYLNKLYKISMRHNAQCLDYVPSCEEMISKILDKMNCLESKARKRSFFNESNMVDEIIDKINPKYRKVFLYNAIHDNMNFNIHYNKKYLEFISSLDKDSVKLLLTDNAYRIYTIINSRTLPENINMLSDNGNIEEFEYNSKVLNNIMFNISDISNFIFEMDDDTLNFLINIYCMSLDIREKTNYIKFANTINNPAIPHEIFEQLKNKYVLQKIEENYKKM